MKLLYTLLPLVNSEQIIKNINVPSCRNCVHYNPPYYGDFSASYSKCKKFGTKDIITNTISYNDYADTTRQDETKCGIEGKYFEEEKNINFKIVRHQFIKNLPNILILSTLVFQLFVLLK